MSNVEQLWASLTTGQRGVPNTFPLLYFWLPYPESLSIFPVLINWVATLFDDNRYHVAMFLAMGMSMILVYEVSNQSSKHKRDQSVWRCPAWEVSTVFGDSAGG